LNKKQKLSQTLHLGFLLNAQNAELEVMDAFARNVVASVENKEEEADQLALNVAQLIMAVNFVPLVVKS